MTAQIRQIPPRAVSNPEKPICQTRLGARLLNVYTQCLLRVYASSHERSPDPPRLARAAADPRLRPQARLRHLLRPGEAAAVRPGIRHAQQAGPRRQGE